MRRFATAAINHHRLGAWLVICPWVLGISSSAVRNNFVVIGLLVLALAFYEIWDERRQSGNQT
jgi:hypothetical protein